MNENYSNMTKDEIVESNCEEKVLSVIKIILPNGESVDLQIDSLELVQEIHFILTDREETCHRTCFSLKLNNKILDNFADLKLIPELEDNVEIFVFEEMYNVREAKFHIKHIHDLLRSVELADAYLGRDQMSLSFVNIVTDGILSDTKCPHAGDSLDSQPPDHILPSACNGMNGTSSNSHLNGPALSHLHPIENEMKPNSCLISLNYSNWNPPPSHRVLHGDLVYLYVHTLEDKRIHITGCSKGFYVNQSTDQAFNPRPASHPYLSHSLIDLLKLASPLFKRNYDSLLKKRSSRHAFERIPTPYQVYSWLSPVLEHSLDSIRKEEAFCSKMAYEEHLPGQTRDWNDEMQNTRELPRDKLIERVTREKSIFKTNSDFVTAATRAAVNVLRGNIMAINPGECKKQQMFIWNNIFFALGFDIKDHYKDFGGDAAAYAANMNDLNGVRAYSSLDIPGLCTLGTAVIDFCGYRVTAQTLIPGILEKEHDESVVYGSYDFGKTVVLEERYLELLDKPSDELKIMPHRVMSKDGTEVLLNSSIECKGIIGNDKRYYILDLLFTSPPDAHYLGGTEDDTKTVGLKCLTKTDLSASMANLGYPFAHRHQLSVLRQELLEAFCEYRYIQFLRHIKSNIDDAKAKKKEIVAEDENKIELTEDTSLEDVKSIVDETGESEYDEVLIKEIIAKSAEAVGSLNDSKVIIKFNPDAFQIGVTVSDAEKANVERDRQLLKDASEFLVKIQIPQLIKDSLDEIITPQDGRSLVEAMHQKGINTRYLNRLIETIPNTPSLSWLKTLAVSETVIRSTKHIFNLYIQSVDPMNMSSAIAHFLNCFLSSCPNPIPCTSSDEITKMNKTAKKNKRNKGKTTKEGNGEAWMSEIPNSLWTKIKAESISYFHYDINCNDVETFCMTFNVSRTTLLRNLCLSVGIQLLLRDYSFDQKNKQIFNDEDVLNVYPIVKHLNPQATDAYKLFSSGQAHISHGHFAEGRQFINEALNLLNQVYGPLHADIASCNRLLAHLSYVLGEYQAAIMYQYRATMISERVHGIDSSNIISEYCHLGLYAFACGQFNVALNCMYRARYVALLCHGDIHPEMPNIDTNIGIMLVAVQNYERAIQFLENALETSKIFYGVKSMKVASSYHLIARINSHKGDFRAAIQAEKECFNIYKEKLGQENERTKESKTRLSYWTGQAVNIAKIMQELANGADNINHTNLPGDIESVAKAKAMAGMIPQMHLQNNPQPNMFGLLDTLNLVNGIYLIQLNDEDFEKIKMELPNNSVAPKECDEVQS